MKTSSKVCGSMGDGEGCQDSDGEVEPRGEPFEAKSDMLANIQKYQTISQYENGAQSVLLPIDAETVSTQTSLHRPMDTNMRCHTHLPRIAAMCVVVWAGQRFLNGRVTNKKIQPEQKNKV